MILVEKLERDFLIRVAIAMPGGMSRELAAMVDELKARGRYASASEDEIEDFDLLFEAATDKNDANKEGEYAGPLGTQSGQ